MNRESHFFGLSRAQEKSEGAEHVEQFIFCSSNNHFLLNLLAGTHVFAKTILHQTPDAYVSATQATKHQY